MTKILKLEMKGFKSFARHTDLSFGDDYNVVIGPNGSGKSNIIDALCFVLGKSSAKSLRAEKSANLIYNGGKTKQPAKDAEVAITFDNQKQTFPLPDSTIKVSRTIHENGNSTYRINAKKHTRQEVIDLLGYARINPDGYNIILQGDVIHFTEMGGEERRKVIEQISDISIYEDKKQKALNELTKVDESFKEASLILHERAGYLKELSKEREQALKYQEYDVQIKRGRATILFTQAKQKDESMQKITQGNESNAKKQDEIKAKMTSLHEQVSHKKQEVQDINTQIEAQGSQEQKALHKKVEDLRIDVASAKAKLQATHEEIARIQERKKQLELTKEDNDAKIAKAKQEEQAYVESKERTLKLKDELQKKLIVFKQKHKLEAASDVEATIDALDKQIEESSKEADLLREQSQELLRTKDRLELQIRTADEKIDKVKTVSEQHHKELDILTQKRSEIKKVTLELSKALAQDSSLVTQLSNAKQKGNFLAEELARISAKKASIQETLGASMAITKVIENKQRLGGVHGTVSSLGVVDTKFAKALEVAAGTKIKAIIVDDEDVASRAIEFLKQNQLGVATFLPLTKIKPVTLHEQAPKSSYGYALDLIKFDSRYKNAFSHVFANTVVVEDITSAKKIGIGTNRMVTLDGDLAESSGAMQGGFRKAATSGLGFSQKEVNDKQEQYQIQAQEIQQVIDALMQKKIESEEVITRLRELKATLEGDTIKMEKSLHLDDSDFEVTKKLKEEFVKDLALTSKQYQEVGFKISAHNSNLAKLKVEKTKLKDTITAMKSPTVLAELATFEEKVRTYADDIIRIDGELKNIANQITNIFEPEREHTLKVLKHVHKEIADFTQGTVLLDEKMKAQQVELDELQEKEQAFSKQFSQAIAKRTQLLTAIDKLDEAIIEEEERLRETERKSTVVSIELAKLKAEYDVLMHEYEEFKDVELYTEELDEIKKRVAIAQGQITRMGAVNMKSLEIYAKVEEEYQKLLAKKEILAKEKEQVLIMINEIETRKKELFLVVFNRINDNFQRIFSSLVSKAESFIELENPEQPFEGGVNIKVRLAGKKFMDIRSLSGGEKTMTAMAFIFAIQENDPASFYILDEVDAALDKHNSEQLAKLIQAYSDRAQYIVISHNDGMIASANIIYGVSMDIDGISKIVSLKV